MTVQEAIVQAYKNGVEAGKRAAHTWIPVSERLPEKAGQYLVCDCNSRFPFPQVYRFALESRLGTPKGWYYCDSEWGDISANKYVTHWMPLPDAPKEVR